MRKDKKNITIYDIAKEAGVSASLVSRVVSGNGSVSEENRKKIKELIKKYNFKPNGLARSLQKSQTKMIGFVLPHVGNEYFSSVYYQFEKKASEKGYITILCNGKNDEGTESRLLSMLEESRVEAIVFMGGRADVVDIPEKYIEEFKKLQETIPCVLCTSNAQAFGCVGVHGDDEAGVDMLVAHLAEEGYQSFGILGGAYSRWPVYHKKNCFREAARKYNLELREEWIIGNSFDVWDGSQAMGQLLLQKELPEVVCCINDQVAVGAMNRAKDAGLRIPEDIAITGYDGVEASLLARPSITTISHNYREYGETIFEAITTLLEGKEYNTLTLIEPQIIVRESSKKHKKD